MNREDCYFCFTVGADSAEMCVKGFPIIEERIAKALSVLTPKVRARFSQELVYFRIFVMYCSFQSNVESAKFELFLAGFQTWLKGYWHREIFRFNKVNEKISEYSEKFLKEKDNSDEVQFISTDLITDELLVNSGFGVRDFISFDRTELKLLFKADFNSYKKLILRGIWTFSLTYEERIKEMYSYFDSQRG